MKNQVILFFFFVILYSTTYGQSAYYSTGKVVSSGVTLISGTDDENTRFCHVKSGTTITKYTPYEVIEYGFEDGRVFVSKEIVLPDGSGSRVFLEQLGKGNANLYYFKDGPKKSFYLEKESLPLTEIIKGSQVGLYRDQLKSLINDCKNMDDAFGRLNYNKKSMAILIKRYNECDDAIYPYTKFGFYFRFGYSSLNYKPVNGYEFISDYDFNYEFSPGIGLFIDKPVTGNLSFLLELNYFQNEYNYSNNTTNKFKAQIYSLNMPLIFRYYLSSGNLRPYLNAGFYLSRNLSNSSIVIENQDYSEDVTNSLMQKLQVGYTIGVGLEMMAKKRISYFIELRNSGTFASGFSKINFEFFAGLRF